MIGIGKWEATISFMFQKYTGSVEIFDNNGEYDFKINLPEKFKDVKIRCFDIKEVGNDTLTGKGELLSMPGNVAEVSATFNGDKMTGWAKVMGIKVSFKNGHKIG